MLTHGFDLLYAIYEEEGYEPDEIPEKSLTHNLYGIEIDERAGELAAFALTMKARSRSRRFFRKAVKPNICVLENVMFDERELAAVESEKWVVGSEKQQALHHDLHLFEEANNFGSLLRPQLPLSDIESVLAALHSPLPTSHSLFEQATLNSVKVALEQASYLSPKYHVVIANPPYMGSKGMNSRLGKWAKDNFPNSKSDLFAMFIERNLDLAQKQGAVAMITMQSWMFLSSFEKLRSRLLAQDTILSMAHLGVRAFDSIGGEVVSTTAFILENENRLDYKGSYLRLINGNSEAEKEAAIREAIKNPYCGWFYRASAADFKKVPGSPIAYWVSDMVRSAFDKTLLADISILKHGMSTSDNDRFMRQWFEVSYTNLNASSGSAVEALKSKKKWFPFCKGGSYRRWYGNADYVVNWKNNGKEIKDEANKKYPYLKGSLGFVIGAEEYYFREAITWSSISSSSACFRSLPKGFIMQQGANSLLKYRFF